jgi:glutamate synthase domain-containing protein 2
MAPNRPRRAVPHHVGGSECQAPLGVGVQHLGQELWSLSPNAIRALNKGAKLGGFARHGEALAAITAKSGDLGSRLGYFCCRNNGSFCLRIRRGRSRPQIKMVELKPASKPGHGGVLPAAKVTKEIAEIRGVEMGQDCISPAKHSAFATPIELMQFIARLRALSGGKPTGFKLCVGHPWEFLAVVKAMLETGITPDFIVIDGKEGGTGAAPLEFMDHLGMPLREGLTFVHSALIGANLRDKIKLGAAGKIVSGFDMARVMALGADWCNAARGFMFAVGCLQSQQCHTDRCPTGVATQDRLRQRAIVLSDKSCASSHFHKETVQALGELIAAAGLNHLLSYALPFHAPHGARPHRQLHRALPLHGGRRAVVGHHPSKPQRGLGGGTGRKLRTTKPSRARKHHARRRIKPPVRWKFSCFVKGSRVR